MKRILLYLLLSFAPAINTASEISNVSIQDASYRQAQLSLLIRNDSSDEIREIEARACYSENDCQTIYIGEDFPPHRSTWSKPYRSKKAIIGITLLRIQSVQVQVQLR